MSWGKIATAHQRTQFRNAVAKRLGYSHWDDVPCMACQCHSYIQIHHIYPVEHFIEIAFEPENAIPLCRECHRLYHLLCEMMPGDSKQSVNPNTLAEFLNLQAVNSIYPHIQNDIYALELVQ